MFYEESWRETRIDFNKKTKTVLSDKDAGVEAEQEGQQQQKGIFAPIAGISQLLSS